MVGGLLAPGCSCRVATSWDCSLISARRTGEVPFALDELKVAWRTRDPSSRDTQEIWTPGGPHSLPRASRAGRQVQWIRTSGRACTAHSRRGSTFLGCGPWLAERVLLRAQPVIRARSPRCSRTRLNTDSLEVGCRVTHGLAAPRLGLPQRPPQPLRRALRVDHSRSERLVVERGLDKKQVPSLLVEPHREAVAQPVR